MLQSETINDLSAALAKAQAGMKAATYNRTNPHFKNKYADLASVLEAIRKPLADHALSITQTTEMRDSGFALVTTLRHASGQWIASEYPLPATATPQQLGSALTYARRYSLSAIACIAADEDDDAEGARKDNQVATMPKRENPHVTRPEDISDAKPRHDAAGNRIDWIDTSMFPDVARMPKAKAREIFGNLGKQMMATESPDDLVGWGEAHAELVAALPQDWEEIMQSRYQEHLDQLRTSRRAAE